MGKTKTSKRAKRKTASKRKRSKQRGGGGQFLVDWKKGYKVTKDMIEAVKKPIDVKKAKKTMQGYRGQYQTYKRGGGTKSYNSWLIDKGYAERDSGCSIM